MKFLKRTLEKIVAPAVLAGAMLFGGGNANAQEVPKPATELEQSYKEAQEILMQEQESPEERREARLKEEIDAVSAQMQVNSLHDQTGLHTQEKFKLSLTEPKLAVVAAHEHTPARDIYGLDITNTNFRVNVGHGRTVEGVDSYRGLMTLYADGAFLGAKYLNLTDGLNEHISMHAGVPFGETLEARVMLGDTGISAIGFLKNKDSTLGVGGGSDFEGNWDANISYASPEALMWVRGGEVMPLDVRLFVGNPGIRRNMYAMNVTGSGFNERDDFAELDDPTFRFGLGSDARTRTDFYGASGAWLGPEVGNIAVNLRFQEGNRAIAELGYRASENLTVMLGVRAEIVPGTFADVDRVGLQNQVQYSLNGLLGIDSECGDISLRLNTWIDERGEFEYGLGVGGSFTF